MSNDDVLYELLSKVKQRADTYAYFFDKLDSAKWIRPLREAGFFQDPIGVEQLENGFVRFPLWPESRALARLASQDEEAIAEIILACPDTDNPRVHDDFVDAALQMSPESGALLVPRIEGWLQKPYKLLMPQKAGKLLVRLSEARLTDAALALAGSLLKLKPGNAVALGDDPIEGPPQFHALFDSWDYKIVLEEDVPAFVTSLGLPALDKLCAALQDPLRAEGERFGGPPHDASYIWRPSIAESEQNIDREPKDFLVTAIREAADRLITSGEATVTDVVSLLEGQGWEIFERLAIRVATVHADREPGEAVRLLLRRDLLEAFEVSNEYCALVRSGLPLADGTQIAEWLSWIAEGPSSEDYIDMLRSRGEPDPSPEELAERADLWRWRRIAFAPVEVLDTDSRRMRDELAARFDEPSPMPFAVYTSRGSVSPIDIDEAASMTLPQLAEYASRIPPTVRHYESPEEGFASVLEAQARTRPADVSAALVHFRTLKPLYLRSLVSGLRDAAREGANDINWRDVLEQSQWVLQQPREVEGGSGGTYADLDPGWVWTISAVADLLEEGLRKRLLGIEVRDATWEILTALLVEPEGDLVDSDDPGTDSLNRTRGKALHAIVMYADWLFEMNRANGEPPPRAFSSNSPEVAAVLDAALNPDDQPSRAVRAVFGMRAPYLMKLDPEWMASRADRIFSVDPKTGSFDQLGLAAWGSYLKYSKAYLDLMAVIRPQYEVAVAAISGERGDVAAELQRHLAEHLMVQYWHGRLGSGPFEDPLLAEFWHVADASVRKRALRYVGHSLRDVRESMPQDVEERLKRLWDDYVDQAKAGNSSDLSELRVFGWWVYSQAFEPSWVIPRTVDVLELSRGIDSPGEVISVLARAPESELAIAAKALRLIVANDREGWAIFGHQNDARSLVKAALESADREAVEEARAVADVLIARGFSDVRELVEGSQ